MLNLSYFCLQSDKLTTNAKHFVTIKTSPPNLQQQTYHSPYLHHSINSTHKFLKASRHHNIVSCALCVAFSCSRTHSQLNLCCPFFPTTKGNLQYPIQFYISKLACIYAAVSSIVAFVATIFFTSRFAVSTVAIIKLTLATLDAKMESGLSKKITTHRASSQMKTNDESIVAKGETKKGGDPIDMEANIVPHSR